MSVSYNCANTKRSVPFRGTGACRRSIGPDAATEIVSAEGGCDARIPHDDLGATAVVTGGFAQAEPASARPKQALAAFINSRTLSLRVRAIVPDVVAGCYGGQRVAWFYPRGRVEVERRQYDSREETAELGIECRRLLHVAHVPSMRDDAQLSTRDGRSKLLGDRHRAPAIVVAPKNQRGHADRG